jgi:hypothetical protein
MVAPVKIGVDRRKFLMLSASLLGAGFVTFNYKRLFNLGNSASGLIIGGGQGMMNGKMVQYLALVDLHQPKEAPYFYPVNFMPHGIATHPQNPYLLSLFEKKGPGACELDLKSGKVLRTISTDPTRYFYGHGSYSADGNHLYSTETILSSEEGVIVQRNSKTMVIEGLFPTYGANPHDCKLIENGMILAITNGGGTNGKSESIPCVSYVDVKTQKLVKQHKMMDPRFNTGHLIISKDQQLVVSSAPHPSLPFSDPGAISVVGRDGTLKNMNTESIHASLKSETLSLCVDEVRGVVATTSPAGNSVTFWNLKTNELLSSLELPSPRGIVMTADNRYYAISYGKKADLILLDADTRVKTEIEIPQAGYSGSHLYLLNS